MNQSSIDSSISPRTAPSAEAVSRRAYEIWESEGRPEGSDLRHWLQAEQELGAGHSESASRGAAARSDTPAPRNTGVDTRPLQPARAGVAGSREPKRPTHSPFAGEKNGTPSAGQNAAKRKPASAPVL